MGFEFREVNNNSIQRSFSNNRLDLRPLELRLGSRHYTDVTSFNDLSDVLYDDSQYISESFSLVLLIPNEEKSREPDRSSQRYLIHKQYIVLEDSFQLW